MSDTSGRVIEFVANELGVLAAGLTLETTLYGDLELQGDDCDDFFPRFADAFEVSLGGLDISKYFPPEPYLGPWMLRAMLRRIFVTSEPHEVVEVSPLRIGDLVQWVDDGSVPATHGE